MATQLLRTEENERVDHGDFSFIQQVIRDNARQLTEQFLTNPAGSVRHWVVRGFAMTNPTAKDLTVTRGAAILGWRDGAEVKYGLLLSDGDSTKTLDLTAYSSGVHGIYVRFEYADGENSGRVFWDDTGDGSEYAQTIATRKVSGWSLRVEQSNPGAEWLLIGTVDPSDMDIVDKRNFFFEGAVDGSYAPTWGAGNDRNANRALYGISDVRTFCDMVRKFIAEARGGTPEATPWWTAGFVEQSYSKGINVGFTGSAAEDGVAVGDANFNLKFDGGTGCSLYFNTTDYLKFDRATSALTLKIGGTTVWTTNAAGFWPSVDVIFTLGKKVAFRDPAAAESFRIYHGADDPTIEWCAGDELDAHFIWDVSEKLAKYFVFDTVEETLRVAFGADNESYGGRVGAANNAGVMQYINGDEIAVLHEVANITTAAGSFVLYGLAISYIESSRQSIRVNAGVGYANGGLVKIAAATNVAVTTAGNWVSGSAPDSAKWVWAFARRGLNGCRFSDFPPENGMLATAETPENTYTRADYVFIGSFYYRYVDPGTQVVVAFARMGDEVYFDWSQSGQNASYLDGDEITVVQENVIATNTMIPLSATAPYTSAVGVIMNVLQDVWLDSSTTGSILAVLHGKSTSGLIAGKSFAHDGTYPDRVSDTIKVTAMLQNDANVFYWSYTLTALVQTEELPPTRFYEFMPLGYIEPLNRIGAMMLI